jgi:class 3 adenylate cyclase
MKKKLTFLFILIIGIFIISNAAAKIVLSTPAEQYNLGDDIKQDIKVMTVDDFEGFLRVSLICDNSNSSGILLFYSPISTDAGKEKPFSFSFIATIQGKCDILALLEKDNNKIEQAQTSTFIITNKINVELELAKQFFMPEDTLKLSGKATMANGQSFNGAATIFLENKTYSAVVSKGSFSSSILLDKNIAPGKHSITTRLNDDKNNSGFGNITFEVGIVKTALLIKTNKDVINPGELLLITPLLIDQANGTIKEEISIKLVQLENLALGFKKRNFLLEEIVNSGNSTQYRFASDAPPQDYAIEAEGSGFSTEKIIRVPVVEKINLTINNSVLIIENIGNVKYQKPIEIDMILENLTIKKVINPKIDVNSQYLYPLKAPQGDYQVILKSSNDTKTFLDVPIFGLTGSVSGSINLEGKQDGNFFIPTIFLILLLIIVLIIIRRDFFIKVFKPKKNKKIPSKVYGFEVYHGEEKKEESKPKKLDFPAPQKAEIKEKMKMSDVKKQNQEKIKELATSHDARIFSSKIDVIKALYDKYSSSLAASKIEPKKIAGQKQEISVLMLRINGLNDLIALKNKDSFLFNELADNYFSKVIKRIQANNGVADLYNNNLIVFFNVVQQPNHHSLALKTAQEIKKVTQELNQEINVKGQAFQLSISAGLHSGPLILTSIGQDKAVKYTPVQDTTNIAKALEKKAFKNEILMSESFYNKVSNIVQAKKIIPLALADRAIPTYLVQEQSQKKSETPYWIK